MYRASVSDHQHDAFGGRGHAVPIGDREGDRNRRAWTERADVAPHGRGAVGCVFVECRDSGTLTDRRLPWLVLGEVEDGQHDERRGFPASITISKLDAPQTCLKPDTPLRSGKCRTSSMERIETCRGGHPWRRASTRRGSWGGAACCATAARDLALSLFFSHLAGKPGTRPLRTTLRGAPRTSWQWA